jgi:hypothetical protein
VPAAPAARPLRTAVVAHAAKEPQRPDTDGQASTSASASDRDGGGSSSSTTSNESSRKRQPYRPGRAPRWLQQLRAVWAAQTPLRLLLNVLLLFFILRLWPLGGRPGVSDGEAVMIQVRVVGACAPTTRAGARLHGSCLCMHARTHSRACLRLPPTLCAAQA